MDLLSDVIGTMRVGTPVLSTVLADPPWETAVQAFDGVRFYIATVGRIRVTGVVS